jgi:fumarate hydratase class II
MNGHFELNVFKPVMIHNLLSSIALLADALHSFDDNCAKGIHPNRDVIAKHVDSSLMLVTALNESIGYDNAAKVAKSAHARGTTLREEAMRLGFVSETEFDRLVRPVKMIHPG